MLDDDNDDVQIVFSSISPNPYVNSELAPSAINNVPFLYEENETMMGKYGMEGKAGKWMMYYDWSKMDDKWAEARSLYNSGKLVGIHSMKVSTTYNNPRASDRNNGVMIFYCGPYSDEKLMMEIGNTLLREFPYECEPFFGHRIMYYKSDDQTMLGTRATGAKKNHLYKIVLS